MKENMQVTKKLLCLAKVAQSKIPIKRLKASIVRLAYPEVSATNPERKYKEPVKGKGFRNIFRKAGYQVYLVDEFRTSCRCNYCGEKETEGKCSTFRECKNPRPWKNNVIFRHGLAKCKTCALLWNRDTNASLNIHRIIEKEISGLGRPEYLKRTNSSISGTPSVSD